MKVYTLEVSVQSDTEPTSYRRRLAMFKTLEDAKAAVKLFDAEWKQTDDNWWTLTYYTDEDNIFSRAMNYSITEEVIR